MQVACCKSHSGILASPCELPYPRVYTKTSPRSCWKRWASSTVLFSLSGEAPTMTPVVWTWSRPQAQVDPRKVIRIAQRPIYRANILSGGILKHHQQSFGLRPSVMVLLPAPRASVDKDKMALWKHQHAHLLTTLKEALVSKSLARVPGSKV